MPRGPILGARTEPPGTSPPFTRRVTAHTRHGVSPKSQACRSSPACRAPLNAAAANVAQAASGPPCQCTPPNRVVRDRELTLDNLRRIELGRHRAWRVGEHEVMRKKYSTPGPSKGFTRLTHSDSILRADFPPKVDCEMRKIQKILTCFRKVPGLPRRRPTPASRTPGPPSPFLSRRAVFLECGGLTGRQPVVAALSLLWTVFVSPRQWGAGAETADRKRALTPRRCHAGHQASPWRRRSQAGGVAALKLRYRVLHGSLPCSGCYVSGIADDPHRPC
jgi:hypothetical protein